MNTDSRFFLYRKGFRLFSSTFLIQPQKTPAKTGQAKLKKK